VRNGRSLSGYVCFVCLLVERPTDSSTQVRRTWGPSSLQKKDKIQHHRMFTPTTTSATNSWMRWSRSAPNLPKTLSCMGDQSVIRAFTDLGLFLSCFHFKIHFSSVIYNVHSYDTSSACMVAVLSSLPVHPRGTAFHIQSAS